jgi:tRNA1Val (adenine37-N6)-methyltransferase
MSQSPEVKKNETVDILLNGRLRIIQGSRGYRLSLDALLLAYFAEVPGAASIIDLGAGNGAVALALAMRAPSARLTGLEIQEKMVERARRSIALNSFGDRLSMVHGDVCAIERLLRPGSFDLAVSNPPYRRLNSGRMNPDDEKRTARHEVRGRLGDFVHAARYLLRHGGRLAVVYPATRLVDLLQTMRAEELEPKRMRMVHSFAASEAMLVLAEGVKGGRRELEVEAPFVVYEDKKKYTWEMEEVVAGRLPATSLSGASARRRAAAKRGEPPDL